jgi:hypothetical protein
MSDKETKIIPENIDDKLFVLKYKPAEGCHLCVNLENCKKCTNKPCVSFCPAMFTNGMKRSNNFSSVMKTVWNAALAELAVLTRVLIGIILKADTVSPSNSARGKL